jgi:hypothetical protein
MGIILDHLTNQARGYSILATKPKYVLDLKTLSESETLETFIISANLLRLSYKNIEDDLFIDMLNVFLKYAVKLCYAAKIE